MARPISFSALDQKTGAEITNPAHLSASRCLSLLVMCASTANTIINDAPLQKAGAEQLAHLVSSLLHFREQGLDNDIHVLASMLGCELMIVDRPGKVDA